MKAFEKYLCAFRNEAECEEELEDDGLDLEGVEKEHFEEDEKD